MYLEDLFAARHVGAIDYNLAIEAARTQECWIEDVWAVGGGKQDNRLALGKAVHLYQKLVERLLALVVATAQASTTLTAHRIDLVDKDNRGSGIFGLLKQVAYAACAHAHEHLDKVGARNREEGHARLASNRLGKERLAGTWRAHEQNTARDLSAHVLVALGVREEVFDLLEFLNSLVDAGDIFKFNVGAVLV